MCDRRVMGVGVAIAFANRELRRCLLATLLGFLVLVGQSRQAEAVVGGRVDIVETTDFPDNLGRPASGAATTFSVGVNRILGSVPFSRSAGSFSTDVDEVLFEILPGQRIEQITVISGGFSQSGSVSDLEIQQSLFDGDSTALFPPNLARLVLPQSAPTGSISESTNIGSGTYVNRVSIGLASFGPVGTASADYTVEYLVAAVPEPGTAMLLTVAVVATLSPTRRRHSRI